ncbi:MAG: guanosine monophosphate reductase [Patescibacteria group bacterium]
MNQEIPLGLSYDDVLLVPQHSKVGSRSEVDLSTQITPKVKLKLPFISINMTDVTEVDMAVTLGKLGALGFLHRFVSSEKHADMVYEVKRKNVLVGAAVGIRNNYVRRAEMLAKAGADIVTIDVAHAAMQRAINATNTLKSKLGDNVDIISGVIATEEGADDLFKAGADAVRVGVGPGTICTTRITTGVGVPQISAVMEAAKAAKKHKKVVLCDGGTKNSGDIVKGLAAGAAAAVIGSQFAGTDEATGKLVKKQGQKYKEYNASTSLAEKENHIKKLKNNDKNYLKHIEGVKSLVPYKGPVTKIVKNMEANLKSGFSYAGAKNIKELWKNAQFIRITQLGVRESGAHDVIVN